MNEVRCHRTHSDDAGPFTTGLVMMGKDTGEGFTLKQIEENPSGFMADVHSSLAVPGAVRGQFPG